MKADIIKEKLRQIGSAVWKVVSRNVGLKVLSVVFALMLWSYVISSNTSITRVKSHTGLQGYVTGQVTLEVYDLALVSDLTDALSNVSVDVEVPLASYSASTNENVQVTLDVSSVRTAGIQEVPLKATTSYGKVTRIYPTSISVNIEPLDSRSIPVNVQIDGEEEGYWYNCARVNPSQITVSGASSVVQDISSISVRADVAGRHNSYSTSCTIELLDDDGNVIPTNLINRSSSSVSIVMEVYPTKELAVSDIPEDIIEGQLADGYIIEEITVQPNTITVAADQELLDSLDTLVIEPIVISEDLSQSITRRASIAGLSDFKYISSGQVYVNVQVVEETISTLIRDIDVKLVGISGPFSASADTTTVSVWVTGPRSKVEALEADDLNIIVDMTGLGEGTHELPVVIDTTNYSAFEFTPTPATINVTLEADAE